MNLSCFSLQLRNRILNTLSRFLVHRHVFLGSKDTLYFNFSTQKYKCEHPLLYYLILHAAFLALDKLWGKLTFILYTRFWKISPFQPSIRLLSLQLNPDILQSYINVDVVASFRGATVYFLFSCLFSILNSIPFFHQQKFTNYLFFVSIRVLFQKHFQVVGNWIGIQNTYTLAADVNARLFC